MLLLGYIWCKSQTKCGILRISTPILTGLAQSYGACQSRAKVWTSVFYVTHYILWRSPIEHDFGARCLRAGPHPGRRHVRALLGAALVVHSRARGGPVARRARSQSPNSHQVAVSEAPKTIFVANRLHRDYPRPTRQLGLRRNESCDFDCPW